MVSRLSPTITLQEIFLHNSLPSLLEELIKGLNLSLWIEDEQGEVILGDKGESSVFSYPILVEERTIGHVKGNELGRVIANLLNYQIAQEMLILFDDLTKIPNRRYGDRFLEQEWRRSVREQIPLSLLMVDIDYFKFYNDYYGHQQGDECLKRIAQTLANKLRRPMDFVARYGGEEFMIVLPNTNIEGAEVVAELLNREVKEQRIPHRVSPVSLCVTISLGIATIIPRLDQSPDCLLLRADRALYRAKATGRNRFCLDS